MAKLPLLLVVLIAILAVACAESQIPSTRPPAATVTPTPPLPPGATIVQAELNGFSQESLTVEVGTVIIWTNTKKTFHTTTHTPIEVGKSVKWDSGNMAIDESHRVLFDEVGTFRYVCSIHAIKEFGNITVVESLEDESPGAGGETSGG